MTRSRTRFALLVVALLATMVAPVGAAGSRDPRAERDAALSRRARAASELNTLNASERQLVGALKALEAQVSAQNARVQAARQAVAAATAQLSEATVRLERTKAALAKLSNALVARAVAVYMQPGKVDPDGFGPTTDLAARARKQALLKSVTAGEDDLIDQLNAAEEDYEAQRRAAAEARELAQRRKAETEAQLASLRRNRDAQARVAAGVLARKRAVLAEIDGFSRTAAELDRIIRERASQGSSTARNAGGCIWPVRGRVTSEYGRRWGRLHAGIDISARTGTSIWAAKAGTVIFAGRQSGYGNVVIVDHGGGMTTLYAHQSRLASSDGQSVSQGQLIGYVGSTGHSTGPHVHFETRYGGSARNPRTCLP